MNTKEWIYFKCYLLTFEITDKINLDYYHGDKIVSLLSRIFNKHPLTDKVPSFIVPYPLETGKIFNKFDEYPLELTILGKDNPAIIETINWFLAGKENIAEGDFSTYLKLAGIKDTTPQYEESGETSNLVHLKFLSPLRHSKRTKSSKQKFFSPDFFDPEYFLELYYNRLALLSNFYGHPLPKYRKIPHTNLVSLNCNWIDDRFSKTLGGITGDVEFNMKHDKFWDKALWLGQYIHAGLNTNFGFGKYLYIK
jgi:CRISPR-associated endoribonuclease Cas6